MKLTADGLVVDTRAELKTLQTRQKHVQETLNKLERQIYGFEGGYLEQTASYGNVVRGWDGFNTQLLDDKAPKPVNSKYRVFSHSSVTSDIAVFGGPSTSRDEPQAPAETPATSSPTEQKPESTGEKVEECVKEDVTEEEDSKPVNDIKNVKESKLQSKSDKQAVGDSSDPGVSLEDSNTDFKATAAVNVEDNVPANAEDDNKAGSVDFQAEFVKSIIQKAKGKRGRGKATLASAAGRSVPKVSSDKGESDSDSEFEDANLSPAKASARGGKSSGGRGGRKRRRKARKYY